MPDFVPGPTMDPIAEPTGAVASDTAPKRRGRPPGSRNSTTSTRSRSKSLKNEIGGTLTMFNLALLALPPTRSDALDTKEIELLASALDEQAKANPTFRKYLTIALSVTSGGQLISVVGIIAARRMARHEFVLPKEADAMLGQMIGSPAFVFPPAPEPETEQAPHTDANNGTT